MQCGIHLRDVATTCACITRQATLLEVWCCFQLEHIFFSQHLSVTYPHPAPNARHHNIFRLDIHSNQAILTGGRRPTALPAPARLAKRLSAPVSSVSQIPTPSITHQAAQHLSQVLTLSEFPTPGVRLAASHATNACPRYTAQHNPLQNGHLCFNAQCKEVVHSVLRYGIVACVVPCCDYLHSIVAAHLHCVQITRQAAQNL
jgi:hypothetical protein